MSHYTLDVTVKQGQYGSEICKREGVICEPWGCPSWRLHIDKCSPLGHHPTQQVRSRSNSFESGRWQWRVLHSSPLWFRTELWLYYMASIPARLDSTDWVLPFGGKYLNADESYRLLTSRCTHLCTSGLLPSRLSKLFYRSPPPSEIVWLLASARLRLVCPVFNHNLEQKVSI